MFFGVNWHPYASPSHELYSSLVKEWADSLRDLSILELDQGLRLTKQTCPMAPSISKFLRLCYDFYSFDHAFDLINNYLREKHNNNIINQPKSHIYENILANNTAKDRVLSVTYKRCTNYFRDNELHQNELRKIVKEVYEKEIINFLSN